MIDFVKIRYQDKAELEQEILNSGNFQNVKALMDMNCCKSAKTIKDILFCKGDNSLYANYNNIQLKVKRNSIEVKNSLHKFFNLLNDKGNQNYNDFSYTNLVEAIETLARNIKGLNHYGLEVHRFGLTTESRLVGSFNDKVIIII